MPDVQCLTCGGDIHLAADTYIDFTGPAICRECKAHTQVIIRGGQLQEAFGGAHWSALMLDMEHHDIPTAILGDLMEAAVVFTVNALKSCVVMCGRAMHGALLENDVPDRMIGDMLKAARCRNVITEDLYRGAIAANYFRVTGAHAKELRDIGRTQALLTFEVTKDVLKYLFPKSPMPAWRRERDNSEP